jgi:hypothetical protein
MPSTQVGNVAPTRSHFHFYQTSSYDGKVRPCFHIVLMPMDFLLPLKPIILSDVRSSAV